MARIWRAYLNSELSDNFGPIPALSAFTGVPGEYNKVEDIYTYILKELKEAVASLDESIDMSAMSKYDPFFGGDIKKWKKYGNSLRMRLAMRLTAVNPSLAQAEFEDAAKGEFIASMDDIAQVAEKDGWDPYTGVMTRTWNNQAMSTTFNNLVVGLGGVEFPVPDELKSNLKDPYTYLARMSACISQQPQMILVRAIFSMVSHNISILVRLSCIAFRGMMTEWFILLI